MKPILLGITVALLLATIVTTAMVHDYNLLQERVLQLEEREIEQRAMNAKVVIKFGKIDKSFDWESKTTRN
jgi:predicted small secreted protein